MIVAAVRSFAIWNFRSAHKLLGFTSFSAERDAVRNTHQVVQHYYVLLHRVNVWRWTLHCYTTPQKSFCSGCLRQRQRFDQEAANTTEFPELIAGRHPPDLTEADPTP
jgi:hypothetical protein